MAYPYYNPVNYNPTFYPTYTPVQPQNVQRSQTQTQPNNIFDWVQGELAAKSYIIPPNSTAFLMDSEAQKFYIKSTDASGIPSPLRVFEYSETQNAAVSEPKPAGTDKFITREEFEKRLADFAAKKTVKKEVKDDE